MIWFRLSSRAVVVVAFLGAALAPFWVVGAAQTGTLTWEMPSAAPIAQGLHYDLEVDGARWPASLGGVVCRHTAPSTSTCTGSLPVLSGVHMGRLRAIDLPWTGPPTTGYYSEPFILGQVAGGVVVALKPVPPTPLHPRVLP